MIVFQDDLAKLPCFTESDTGLYSSDVVGSVSSSGGMKHTFGIGRTGLGAKSGYGCGFDVTAESWNRETYWGDVVANEQEDDLGEDDGRVSHCGGEMVQ